MIIKFQRGLTWKSISRFFAKNVSFRPFARELFCFATVFVILKMIISILVPEVCTVNLFLNNDWTLELFINTKKHALLLEKDYHCTTKIMYNVGREWLTVHISSSSYHAAKKWVTSHKYHSRKWNYYNLIAVSKMVSWDPGNKKKIFGLEPRKKPGRFQMTTVTYRSTCCLLYGDSIQVVQ
jgi:hypothetical protein